MEDASLPFTRAVVMLPRRSHPDRKFSAATKTTGPQRKRPTGGLIAASDACSGANRRESSSGGRLSWRQRGAVHFARTRRCIGIIYHLCALTVAFGALSPKQLLWCSDGTTVRATPSGSSPTDWIDFLIGWKETTVQLAKQVAARTEAYTCRLYAWRLCEEEPCGLDEQIECMSEPACIKAMDNKRCRIGTSPSKSNLFMSTTD